ncbi:MAG TPA: hypothetical protein VFW77_04740 [Candidatus Saccharimonadales bacterium]|nr:hypothetical protein [Candidatus Saccharimonadales bacterium]
MQFSEAEIEAKVFAHETIESPLSPEAIIVIHDELAAPHAGSEDGRFRLVEEIPTSLALYEYSEPIPGFSPKELARGLEKKRYPEVVEAMHTGHQAVMLDKIAEGLEDNKKYVLNLNHASLTRSGMGFLALMEALEDIGVTDFETAGVIGAMVTQLEVMLKAYEPGRQKTLTKDDYILATAAAGLICDHRVTTVPNSERVKKSGLMAYEDEVTGHRTMAKGAFKALSKVDKAMLILLITSGTHDILVPGAGAEGKDKLVMRRVGGGSSGLAINNGLEMIQMNVQDIPGYPYNAVLLEPPERITSHEQVERKMVRTARFQQEATPDVEVEYEGLIHP